MVVAYDPLREKEDDEKVKVTIQLGKKEFQRIQRTAEKLQVSISDVVRMQILYPRFLEAFENELKN